MVELVSLLSTGLPCLVSKEARYVFGRVFLLQLEPLHQHDLPFMKHKCGVRRIVQLLGVCGSISSVQCSVVIASGPVTGNVLLPLFL